MYVEREIRASFLRSIGQHPVVTLFGPRGSGKTSFLKHSLHALSEATYVDLEDAATAQQARQDPSRFLEQFDGTVVLDEIFAVTELLPALTAALAEPARHGQLVLASSRPFSAREVFPKDILEHAASFKLLPLSIGELASAGVSYDNFESYCVSGFLPGIHADGQNPEAAYKAYCDTFFERDVPQLLAIEDNSLVQAMLKNFPNHIGAIFHHTTLDKETGVDSNTIHYWTSILSAMGLLFELPSYRPKTVRRVARSPHYYFSDVGLLCHLLGLSSAEEVRQSPMAPTLFENLVISECLKICAHNQLPHVLRYFNDLRDTNVELLLEDPAGAFRALCFKLDEEAARSSTIAFNRIKKVADTPVENFRIIPERTSAVGEDSQLVYFKELARVLL